MDLQPQPLPFAPAALRGFSERLVQSHHANNYGGAVKRLNAIRRQLQDEEPQAPGFVLNGLKRGELLATNSMLLHELYFASLGGDGETMQPAWQLALSASFGSVANWRARFAACGKALAGGSGWVVLTFQPREGTLVNQWAADHTQAIAGGVPLLALDMYEHAYHLDYGAAAGDYVDAFMRNIDHAAVYARYQAAVHAAGDPYGCDAAALADAQLFDVRRAGVYEAATDVIEGAQWRDPASVAEWSQAVDRGRPVVVYCIYGHEVGRATALQLRAAGIDAKFLRGGIDAWQRAGGPLQPRTL